MWQIDLDGEARHYILDNYPYIGKLIGALDELSNSEDGVPASGAHNDNGDILWDTVGHLIVYRRYPTPKRIVITVIKPRES